MKSSLNVGKAMIDPFTLGIGSNLVTDLIKYGGERFLNSTLIGAKIKEKVGLLDSTSESEFQKILLETYVTYFSKYQDRQFQVFYDFFNSKPVIECLYGFVFNFQSIDYLKLENALKTDMGNDWLLFRIIDKQNLTISKILIDFIDCYKEREKASLGIGFLTAIREIKQSEERIITAIKEPKEEIPLINTELFRDIFSPAEDAFHSMIIKNFLFEYQGEQSDYIELLSQDLRKLFYSKFNQSIRNKTTNRLVIMGHEGSGKTFNSLLLGLRLLAEGYSVYYCSDVRHTLLKADLIRKIDDTFDNKHIFLIDNCHTDIAKVEDLVAIISKHEKNSNGPNYIFLTRPLDKDTAVDVFGQNIPAIIMFDNLIDFDKLINFFLNKLKAKEDPVIFLKRIEERKLSGAFLKYRNMAFWNEAFRSIHSEENISFREDDIFKRTHLFLQRHEQNLLDLRFDILKMLPFFAKGISIHLDYATSILDIPANSVQRLIVDKIISIKAQDWEKEHYKNDSALFYTFGLHPTKARILLYIYNKYYDLAIDSEKTIVDYLKKYPHNHYYILSPIYDKDELNSLYQNNEMILLTREYFRQRSLGKMLDRVIRRLGDLDEELKARLYDNEIIEVFANRINQKGSYIVSKLYLMRSLYKGSPRTTYEVFEKITPAAIIDTFLENPERRGIYSLSKWMEILKNLYDYADTEDKKEFVSNFVKKILDACSQEFIDRFDESDIFFSQFHWMLKRLSGLKLSSYFLAKVTPKKLVEFIKTKDINAVELSRYVLKSSKYTSFKNEDGVESLYYDYLKDHLTYDDIKRAYDNSRTGLYDIAVNAIDPILVDAFVKYVNEQGFKDKVAKEPRYLFNRSLELVKTNYMLTDENKNLITEVINSVKR